MVHTEVHRVGTSREAKDKRKEKKKQTRNKQAGQDSSTVGARGDRRCRAIADSRGYAGGAAYSVGHVSRHALSFPLLDFSLGGTVSPARPLPATSPPVGYYKAALLPLSRLAGVPIQVKRTDSCCQRKGYVVCGGDSDC